MRSLILTHSMFQDQEVLYPYYRLREEGKVILLAERPGPIKGILGTEINAHHVADDAEWTALLTANSSTFDLLVLPGGVKAMEKLRQSQTALDIIKSYWNSGGLVASICSGAQMLISARVDLKRRRLAAYPAMAVDVENAGAVFVNEPVVVDENLVSSPHYRHLAEWMRATIELWRARQ